MSFLTTKYGPLPLWGWGAAAGGGLLVLKMRKGSQQAQNPNQDPNQTIAPGAGAPGASQAFMFGGSGNIDQTFGGGSLGMYGYPYYGGSNMFVNLFRHPWGDSWMYGRHGYPFHGFDRFPFFNWGGLFGRHGRDGDDWGFRHFGDFDDRGRGFGHGFGDRGVGWNNDPYQYPRGASGGSFGPGGTNGPASRFVDNNASSPGNHVR